MFKKNYLYWRISATLLTLLVILGIGYVFITSYVADQYVEEANQRLYGGLADSMLTMVNPIVNDTVNTEDVQEIMYSMMVINGSVEVYLLNTKGEILTYVAPRKKIKLKKVELGPIKKFIAAHKRKEKPFITGDDPRHPGEYKVFSAAPIIENEKLAGYVYIILASEERLAVKNTLFGSYILKLGTNVFFLTLIGALILGLFAIWYLTKNLRHIVETVRQFKEGDLQARVTKTDKQDMAVLADTFNEMADTIVANIDKLKSVEKLRQELIANVSHDLRTPLAIMQGYVETMLMKGNDLSSHDQQRYLEIVLSSSEKLAHLVSQLFEYSKLEAKQIELKKEPFFIAELAQDIFQKYQVLAEKKGVKMTLDMPPPLPLVFADLSLVERVIQNLMDNALKFTPEGGKISMQLKDLGNNVEVKIADNGPGISEKEQFYIFERYQKISSSTNTGAGLGLAIVKKILELHNATIRVQSKLNHGTSFVFQLPTYSNGQVSGSRF